MLFIFVFGIIQDGLSERNEWAAGGLLLFCLAASTHFLAWPVSRDDPQNRRFNPDFAWLSIYLGVAALCALWLWLLFR